MERVVEGIFIPLVLLFIPAVFFFGPQLVRWLEHEIEEAYARWSELLSRDPDTPKFSEWWIHQTPQLTPCHCGEIRSMIATAIAVRNDSGLHARDRCLIDSETKIG